MSGGGVQSFCLRLPVLNLGDSLGNWRRNSSLGALVTKEKPSEIKEEGTERDIKLINPDANRKFVRNFLEVNGYSNAYMGKT